MAKVIIVDDSPIMKKMLAKILSQNGHEVIAQGKDGAEGMELYTKHHPDVLLLDITMPNRSGVECLEDVIQSDPKANVIMFSSVSDESSVQNCKKIGAKAFIKKDVNLFSPDKVTEILTTIDNVLAS